MLIEFTGEATVTRFGKCVSYKPGQRCELSPEEIAQIVIRQDKDVAKLLCIVSLQKPQSGFRASWRTAGGDNEAGFLLTEFKYGEESMLLVLKDGKGRFVSRADVQFDPDPILQAAREAGWATLSDRGPMVAEMLVRTLLQNYEANSL